MSKWKRPNGSRECGACGCADLPTTKVTDARGDKHRLCWTCFRSCYAMQYLANGTALPAQSSAVYASLQARSIIVSVMYANGAKLEGVE